MTLADLFSFPLFPDRASTGAARVDHVYFAMLILCGGITLLVAGLLTIFCVKYRAGSSADRTGRIRHVLKFELTWITAMFIAFVAIFIWAASIFFQNETPPLDARTIYVVGKQWMWKAEHAGGQREINELHIPVNQPTKLVLASQDVIHSFYVPAFRMKQDAVPGRFTSIWFTPNKVGEYHLFCAELCGPEHSGMTGSVVVMDPAEFEHWLASEPMTTTQAEASWAAATDRPTTSIPGTPGARGASLSVSGRGSFYQLGCNACHTPQASIRAPRLDGLWHRYTKLINGQLVLVDEQYIRESILNPNAKIVAGYSQPSLMPTYQGQVTEDQLIELVEFIKSLEHGWPEEDRQR
jgi:cytochrome c oxidase subunit II